MAHKYTLEQIEFIKNNATGRSNKDLTEMFNDHFGLKLGLNQIRAFKKNHGIKSGLDCRFKPGEIPWNKGKKGVSYEGCKATQFKKGDMPHNWVPVGSERITKDGYIQIKIQEGKFQKNWKGKHILIWEAANGPVPKGHAIIFGDGDKRNFDLKNLLLVSRAQLARLNQNNLIQNDAELTKTGIIIADIYSKIGERKNDKGKGVTDATN